MTTNPPGAGPQSEGSAFPHLAVVMMKAHLLDPKSTVQSVGVLYAFCIAANPKGGTVMWRDLHDCMRERFKPESDAAWIKKLDAIKTVGWKLHDATCALLSARGETK